MHVHNTLACPKCASSIGFLSRPILDPLRDEALYQAFVQDRLNPKHCSSCGIPVGLDTPTVVNGPRWVGVVLENPSPIPAFKALEIVSVLTEGLGIQNQTPGKPILVVGRAEELRSILANRPEHPFCALAMTSVARRNHTMFIGMLVALAGAYLAEGRPEQAYWMFPEILSAFNDLYYDPDFFNLVEKTAHAAGDRIAHGLIEARTAPEDWQRIKSVLEPHRQVLPEWCDSTFLCFYEKGSVPWANEVSEAWSTLISPMQLNQEGAFDVSGVRRRYITVLTQAVAQQNLSAAEQARQQMLYLMTATNSTEGVRLHSLNDDVQWDIRDSRTKLAQKWQVMNPTERDHLADIYRNMTGLDFHSQFQLG
jgi:hypothetical protein